MEDYIVNEDTAENLKKNIIVVEVDVMSPEDAIVRIRSLFPNE